MPGKLANGCRKRLSGWLRRISVQLPPYTNGLLLDAPPLFENLTLKTFIFICRCHIAKGLVVVVVVVVIDPFHNPKL